LIVERTNNSKTKTMKSFAVILAAAVAAAQGQVILPGNFAPAAGLPFAYNGLHGLAPGFAAAPAVYAEAPIAAPLPTFPKRIIPTGPKTYAVPPARIVNEPAVVETVHEAVEQHGYKIKY
jgi:hypothetical protein